MKAVLLIVNERDVQIILIQEGQERDLEDGLAHLDKDDMSRLHRFIGLYTLDSYGEFQFLDLDERKQACKKLGIKTSSTTIRCKSVEEAMRLSLKADIPLIYVYRSEGLWEKWKTDTKKKKYLFRKTVVVSTDIRNEMSLPNINSKKLSKFYGEKIAVVELVYT